MNPQARIDQLEAAIRKHRDQRGDDRCWLDDLELYAVLPEGPPTHEAMALPPREQFLANCARFHESRQAPGTKPDVGPEGRWCSRAEVALIEIGRSRSEKNLEDRAPDSSCG